MKNLISFSVRHPISILMVYLALIIGGLVSLNVIQVDFLPKMNDRYLLINADFDGIPADEMKKLVTIPLEDSLASLKGIKTVSSVTRDGLSLLKIELQWKTDINLAMIECRELIDQSYEILPNGCAKPSVRIFNPYSKETIMLAIISKDNDLEYSRYLVENDIKPRLQRISGVSSITIAGGDKSEIRVIPNKTKIEAMGVSLQSIAEIISSSNYEYPAGNLDEGNKQFLFKTNGLYKNISEIEETPIGYTENGILLIRDICTVEYSNQERKTFFNYNGNDAIAISVYKKSDVSPSILSRAIHSEVRELENMYGDNYEFYFLIDKSDQLKESLKQLFASVIVGIVITIIIILIFFHNVSLSLIVSSIMPLSILFSVLTLTICGKSINLMALSGIAIGIGMVIDPSIVCIENIISEYRVNKIKYPDIKALIYSSTQQVSGSAISSTITTVVVFIPFFFLSEITGQLFSDLSISVISSVVYSCALSLSLIPALLTILLAKDKFKSKFLNFSKIENRFEKSLLNKSHKRWFIPVVILSCSMVGVICLKLLPKEILPRTYNDNISVDILFDENVSLSYISKNSEYICSLLQGDENVEYYCSIGGIENDSYTELSNPETRKERLLIQIKTHNTKNTKRKLNQIFENTGLNYKVESDMSILEEVLMINNDEEIVFADNEDALKAIVSSSDYNGVQYIPNSIVKELEYEPDRTACARFNISSVQTAKIIYDTLEGVTANDFYSNGREIPIIIKYNKDVISNISQLSETKLMIGNTNVPIDAVGKVQYTENEKIFYRYNRNEAKIIQNLSTQLLNDNNVTSLGRIQFNELLKNAVFLIILVLFLLYCVMGAQFESFIIPVFMLLSIPPAFSGAFLLLLITKQSININSIIALIVLFGTTVNNAIILYESIIQTNILVYEDAVVCCKKKLQPITITTLTTICAIIPFSIDPLHKNSQSSMAIAIIGGLILSYFVVLYCIPPILFKFSKRLKKNE